MAKLLLVSDLHKSIQPGEYDAVNWLIRTIDEVKPNALISAGDWGEYLTQDDLYAVISRVPLITVYGNHENFGLIKHYAISDGSIRRVHGLTLSGINGLISGSDGEYTIGLGRFMRVIDRIRRKVNSLDLLIMHQPLYLPDQYPWMKNDEYSVAALDAVKLLKPRLLLNGHMTGGCYNHAKYEWGNYLRVDSSQRFKCYAILNTDDMSVRVFRNGDEEYAFNI
ncbi:metallophosphoesterase family protein [Caldivirga sp. UBA161]|uniref:metallophosphoesterase family protein n=1 Tax=Caldivirga sp. UBA161 TaxID=1915569 RepID=UPI0025C03A5D|nr:metallophosphoesterase [Caldivirga sp. UBA161]